jgi:plastocyanin
VHTVRRVAITLLAAFAVAACTTVAGVPATPGASFAPLPIGAPVLDVVARSSKFDVTELHVGAGRPFGVLLRNEDREPHNLEVRDETGQRVFVGELFSGPDEQLVAVPALESGSYRFLCSAHPYMKGSLLAD